MTNVHRSLDAIREDLSAARSTQAACAQFSSEFHAAKRTADTPSAELANAEYAAPSSAKARPVRTTKSAPTSAASPLVSLPTTITEPAAMRTDADIQALADVAVSCGTHLQDATWVMHQFASLTVDRTTAQGLLQHYARHPNADGSQPVMRNLDARIELALISSLVRQRHLGQSSDSAPAIESNSPLSPEDAELRHITATVQRYLATKGYRT